MNRFLTAVAIILVGLLLADCGKAQEPEPDSPGWSTWSVVQTDGGDLDNLIMVDDTFRARIAGQTFQLRPLPPLRGRWGADGAYVVHLREVKANQLYCGSITLAGNHHDETHGLSVSIIVENERLDLHFWPDFDEDVDPEDQPYCTYFEGHAGHADARN